MNSSFFSELLQTIADRGRALVDRRWSRYDNAAQRSESLIELCEQLLSGRGEASGVALAREVLERYGKLTVGPRIAFFESLVRRFGPDYTRIDGAIEAWRAAPSDVTAADLHGAAEPRRLELLRRLNLAPGGTAALVAMREQLLDAHGTPRRSDRARCGFRPSVHVVVQPRLSGAAPYRLVRRRRRSSKRSSATRPSTKSTTGTICAAASIRRTGAAMRSSIPRWSTSR